MTLTVDIQCASDEPVPDEADILHWIASTLDSQGRETDTEITVRLVDIQEMTDLNQTYRGKTGPTNVLSFPADLPAHLELALLGDIVICAPVVRTEAARQNKRLDAHWAHMAVHGTLHLLGYDHMDEGEATAMEALESDILAALSFPCPYQPGPSQQHPTVEH